jgi:hypothetical protein
MQSGCDEKYRRLALPVADGRPVYQLSDGSPMQHMSITN